MNHIETLNIQLFQLINGPAGSPVWLVEFAKIVADDLIFLIPLLLIGLWLHGGLNAREIALRAFSVAMLGVGINQVIGLGYQHPRPFVLGLGHTWIVHAPDSSFPSDHATLFFGMALAFFMGGARKYSLVIFVGALLVAWARVFLGVHFPMDMAGSALVAFLSWALIAPLWTRAGTEATSLAERIYRRVFAWPISAGWIKS